MTSDALTIIYWVGLGLGVLIVGALQRDGRHYFPAYLLLGLSVGVPPVFYLSLLAHLRSVAAVRQFAADYRTPLILYPLQLGMLAWALFLAVRVNTARLGTRVDLLGRRRPPNGAMIESALVTLQRAERHDLLQPLTAKWLQEDLELRRLMALALARQGPDGRGGTGGDRARLLWRILARRWYRHLAASLALRRFGLGRHAGRPGAPRGPAGPGAGADGRVGLPPAGGEHEEGGPG